MQSNLASLLQERQLINDQIRQERIKNVQATFAKLPRTVIRNMILVQQLILALHLSIHIGNKLRADDQLDLLEVQLNIE